MQKKSIIAAVVLTCMGVLGTLGYILVRKPSGTAPAPSMAELARRFHTGAGPCLRYAVEDSVPDEALARVSDTFIRLGLSSREVGDFAGLFLRWAEERERPLHASDEVDEVAEAVSERASLKDRLTSRFDKDQARRVLADANQRYFAEGTEALERLSPEQQKEVRALWESRPEALTMPNLVKVVTLLRQEETRARLATVAQVLKERAVPGEALSPERIEALTGLPPEAFIDAWENRFTYDTSLPGRVRLMSLGRDGSEGGIEDDADLIHDIVLEPTAAEPANSGEAAMAELPCAPPPAELVFTRAEYEGALKGASEGAPGARIVPAFVDGKAVGFKVFAIRPGSVFARLGLCNSDVVTEVAGVPLTTPERALEVYSGLKGLREVPFHLQRQGKAFDVRVRIQ